jgi:Uma2 family endonuclease
MAVEAPQARTAPDVDDREIAHELQVWRRRFTVDEYYRMGEAGILGPDERVELIDGEILVMSPIGDRHAQHVRRLRHWLSQLLGERALVDTQNPIHLSDRSEPQPDVMVLRPRDDFYATHPRPDDVLLVIEVAETTVGRDRRLKFPVYARLGLPEAWLLIIPKRSRPRLEIHRQPTPTGYQEVLQPGRGEQVSPLALPDLVLSVADLLGP